MVLEPIYEADFSQSSFGFRPNRRTMDAIKYICCCTIGQHKYYWIIEGDISACFDTIHHQRLMELLRERIADRKLLDLIWHFLRAGVMEGSCFGTLNAVHRKEGLLVRCWLTYTCTNWTGIWNAILP